MRIAIIAGEASGDVLGADIMRHAPDHAVFSGVGGAEMTEAGLDSRFPMQELSVMGVAEILPRLPHLLRRIEETAQAILREKPDVIITIDSPDFCFRVVKRVKSLWPQARAMHVVAPTVWAWRPQRAEKLARLYDRLFCLLPFEPPYFEKYGLDTRFIGHPVIQKIQDFSQEKRDKNLFLVLFGSRKGEVKRVSPVFCDVLRRLKRENPEYRFVSPVFDHLKPEIQRFCHDLDIEWADPKQRYRLFTQAGKAIAVSGTAGLELSVFGCPHVIAYKMNPLTYAMIKNRISVRYAHLENIIQDQMLVPEFLQSGCTADALFQGVQALPEDVRGRQAQLIAALSPPQGFDWSDPSLYAF